MDKEKFEQLIKDIGTTDDDVTRRSLLSELSECSGIFDNVAQLETDKTNLSNEIDRLQQENMKLFLKIPNKTEEEARKEAHITEQEKEKPKFEDLFDEKGEIK